MQRLIEKFSESIKVLNDYRNLYHAESSSTEQYRVANAINDILPKFCELIENNSEPVVRCKDCRYFMRYKGRPMCNKGLITAVAENHYCGYGAKMNEEQECEIYEN